MLSYLCAVVFLNFATAPNLCFSPGVRKADKRTTFDYVENYITTTEIYSTGKQTTVVNTESNGMCTIAYYILCFCIIHRP